MFFTSGQYKEYSSYTLNDFDTLWDSLQIGHVVYLTITAYEDVCSLAIDIESGVILQWSALLE